MISPEKTAEMLAAAEKATAGTWKAEGYVVFGDWQASGAIAVVRTAEKAFADTKYIALCDPQTITAILTELITLRSQADVLSGESGELVKRLRADASQLRKMQEQARFGGDSTHVRVANPEFLLSDLSEAADALDAARSQLDALIAETSSDLVERLATVLDLLATEDGRQDKLHDLLETIREQIRIEVAPEHRPDGLMTNIQNAVYAMRGRTRLMDDAAIVAAIREAATAIERLTAERDSDGIVEIAAERRRQIEVEGWTPEHDDQYVNGEMAQAAACYAAYDDSAGELHQDHVKRMWPWADEWWKPRDRLRDLVRAGALIAAEIDRLKRRMEDTQ